MVEVVRASEGDRATLANLIQLYLYDMTATMPFPVGPDGRFAYDFLDRFWQHPYLLRVGDDIAGFALVIEQCPLTGRAPCFFMAEFFVLRAYRGQGHGRAAVSTLAATHQGHWHIATPVQNVPAMGFWSHTLAPRQPEVRDIVFDGDSWRLHAFRA